MDTNFQSFEPSATEQLEAVKLMASVGFSIAAIAARLNQAVEDLSASCLEVIADAKHATNMAVLSAFREMAISKRHWSATLFWMKTHCTHLFDMPDKKGKKPSETPDDPEEESFSFSVYNNDGEPNYPL